MSELNDEPNTVALAMAIDAAEQTDNKDNDNDKDKEDDDETNEIDNAIKARFYRRALEFAFNRVEKLTGTREPNKKMTEYTAQFRKIDQITSVARQSEEYKELLRYVNSDNVFIGFEDSNSPNDPIPPEGCDEEFKPAS
ncbi:Hypothetical protein CINCED_3A003340 [Cinara cedri]|uniref:Uncharacterized protein n=1 Tax=Cinara cedri TaxID=506608 RepID=A0A5E4M588_9HEMI|nr:Hypothetical protein CINCED_3A003340 [Cinara cedri]